MKVVIIGGVAGGAACATRLRRLDESLDITIIERGEHLSFANCGLPYYIGNEIKERDHLFVATKSLFEKRFKINVLNNTNATAINRDRKTVTVDDGSKQYEVAYDKLILSPGAKSFVPDLFADKAGVFTLRNVPDADRIVAYIKQKQVKKAVVIGGGFIGLEVIENLKRLDIETTLVEMSNQVLAPLDFEMSQYVHKELNDNGISLRLNHHITALGYKDNGSMLLTLDDGQILESDIVILSIGIRPESSLAVDSNLEVNARGYIVTNDKMQTSDKDIYALGDAVEVIEPILGGKTTIALAGPAAKQARVVCADIVSGDYSYRGTFGASIAKVFNMQASSVGLNEKQLKNSNINYECVLLHSPSHASYYPDSSPINFKLIYDKDSKKILGAQAVGIDGCDKRIEIVSAYMAKDGTIDDLAWHEQVYAPPYGSAKDEINFAGFVAQNIEDNLVKQCYVHDVKSLCEQGAIFLDVRTQAEFDVRSYPNSVHIDLNTLRDNLDKLDKNKTIIITCAVGLRGYIGARILQEHGFNKVYNLAGGLQSLFMANYKVK